MNKYIINYTTQNSLTIWANTQTEAELYAQSQPNFNSILTVELSESFPFAVNQVVYAFRSDTDAIANGVITDINFSNPASVKIFVRLGSDTTPTMYAYPFVDDKNAVFLTIDPLLAYLSRDLAIPPIPVVPSAPNSLNITSVTSTTLKLTWSLSAGATGYNVYRDNTLITSNTNVTELLVTGLLPGNAYSFRVSAINQAGESPKSPVYVGTTLPTVPAAPINLVTSNLTLDSVTLEWDASLTATSYTVYANNAVVGSLITGTSIDLTDLIPNTTYVLKVTASNAGGESDYSAETSITTEPPIPSIPTGLTANSLTNTSFTLDWLNSTYATTYNIYQDNVIVATGIVNSNLAISGLNPATSYGLEVSAVNVSGESNRSAILPVLTLCDAPTNLVSLSTTHNSVNLDWDTMTGATSYKVYRNSVLIASNVASSTYNNTGLSSATTYDYTVTAVNASGESLESTTLTVLTKPAAPLNLTATGETSSTVDLTWDSVFGADSYNIYQDGLLVLSGLLTTSQTITGLNPSTVYEYIVTAVNATGQSPYSDPYLITTLA